jgi:Sec-independent protein secretion pathway component TatC
VFSYEILTPAALNFFVSYADGAVESLWSIDQYFEFVLVLMLSTGLSFQVGSLTHICYPEHVPFQVGFTCRTCTET